MLYLHGRRFAVVALPHPSVMISSISFSRLVRAASIAAVLPLQFLGAQPSPWRSTHEQQAWYTVIVDQAITSRTSLWFDGSWRRMGLGSEPQQILLRPGLLFKLAEGVRIGAGYGYIATAPHGETPAPTPTREHRAWQQIMLSHHAGPVTLSHRYRFEERWLAPVINDEIGPFAYQQRMR